MFSRILVAIDTTPHSEAILEQARDLAVATGTAVQLIHSIGHDWIEGQDLTMEDQSRAKDQVNAGSDQLLILGSRNHHAWMAFLGTSISDQIAHQSPCPVLLMPHHPAEEQPLPRRP
ncbi:MULTISPECIES: universal stress protein [unclassified Arthrobacter]|uniref:universal stress protein n=1 Tax=unclassified Arthrobacter TaxID=235627 RepID=UPI003399F56E